MIKWENLPERIKNEKLIHIMNCCSKRKYKFYGKGFLIFLCGCFDCTPISGDAADCSGH